ncbi:hypothetical protein [Nocardia terpenica]|uniref:Transposase IS4-like domain-containing protein n=1 Tax=Nocardia terpenica TaxID=455432 RepID=A0A6G9ZEY0_9NOCA|nr:hypothetical protein [Nocardia terpenica]QIS23543.1 hypothetical protein F6W96_39940 [Nocardia terpenica]
MQALRTTRKVTERRKGKVKIYTETVYAVTSLSATDTMPEQIASWLRGHWQTECRLHWVRDIPCRALGGRLGAPRGVGAP